MNKFRVYDLKTDEMLYDGFLLDNSGTLFQVNDDGLIRTDESRYLVIHGLDRKDVSGADIYQNDVVLHEGGGVFEIVFGEHDSNYGFVAAFVKGDSVDYEDVSSVSRLEKCYKVIGYCVNGKITYLPEDKILTKGEE